MSERFKKLGPKRVTSEGEQRRIKSFVLRQGRLSKAQQNAIDTQWPRYGVEFEPKPLDFTELYGRDVPTYLEIGFGMGASLAQMAENHPERNYLGIEVHRPGVGALLKEVSERDLTNVRVMNYDAIEVLDKMIPDSALAGVYLFFPDPWHKKRHHKRRIVQPEFVAKIAQKLQPNGIFHLATDWENYAEHMMEVMSQAPDFENTQDEPDAFTPRPDERPLTKFEARGQRLGHGVWDLVFRKKGS
jgi:tRNA (guanine-N7-)-methyltransferase